MSATAQRGPLAGVRVLDLTRLLPGPVATQHLADQGAEVIKIEAPGDGDYARTMGAGPEGTSVFFRAVNRNKRGMRLDLRQREGQLVLQRLAAEADVLVESFRPGVMQRLGIGYETLAAINPRLVYCSITGYGQDGPWAHRAGHDLNYIAVSGVLDAIGYRGGPPAIPNLQIGDLLGGAMTAAFAMITALWAAQQEGKGRHVDVAMADSVLAHNLFPLFALANGDVVPARGLDDLSGGQANYAVYATQDGRYLAVAALEEKFWRELCAALARPDLAGRYHEVRTPEVRAILEEIFAGRTLAAWTAHFAEVDCCVTPVLSMAEACQHPQFQARQMVFVADGILQLAPPVRLTTAPAAVHPAPVAADDAAEILAAAGYDAAAIAALRAAAVI